MFWLADLVLAIHFALAAFVTLGLLLIPVGAICSWQWVRNRIFRTVHAGLMVFVRQNPPVDDVFLPLHSL